MVIHHHAGVTVAAVARLAAGILVGEVGIPRTAFGVSDGARVGVIADHVDGAGSGAGAGGGAQRAAAAAIAAHRLAGAARAIGRVGADAVGSHGLNAGFHIDRAAIAVAAGGVDAFKMFARAGGTCRVISLAAQVGVGVAVLAAGTVASGGSRGLAAVSGCLIAAASRRISRTARARVILRAVAVVGAGARGRIINNHTAETVTSLGVSAGLVIAVSPGAVRVVREAEVGGVCVAVEAG